MDEKSKERSEEGETKVYRCCWEEDWRSKVEGKGAAGKDGQCSGVGMSRCLVLW